MKTIITKVEAFIAAHPVVGIAAKAFVLAAVPFVIAGYAAHGLSGITLGVIGSAVTAGLHAVYQMFLQSQKPAGA
jgi:hypothetical protein